MRTQEKSKRNSTAMALALGILIMMFAAPAHAVCPSVVVLGTSVSGSSVYVTVKNTTLLPQVRSVSVQVVMGDTAVWSLVPVTLLPFQTMTVRAGFSSVVSSVGTVGIQDDPSPY